MESRKNDPDYSLNIRIQILRQFEKSYVLSDHQLKQYIQLSKPDALYFHLALLQMIEYIEGPRLPSIIRENIYYLTDKGKKFLDVSFGEMSPEKRNLQLRMLANTITYRRKEKFEEVLSLLQELVKEMDREIK